MDVFAPLTTWKHTDLDSQQGGPVGAELGKKPFCLVELWLFYLADGF